MAAWIHDSTGRMGADPVQHVTVVSSVWITRDLSTSALIAFQIGSSSQADWAIQPHKVFRDSSTPWRAKIPSCRYSGR